MAKEDEIIRKAEKEALDMIEHSGPIPGYLDEYSREIQQLPTVTEKIAEEQMARVEKRLPSMPEVLRDAPDFERRKTAELMKKAEMSDEMKEKLMKSARKSGLMKKVGGKGLKKIPAIGGLAAALYSGEAEGAEDVLPLLSDVGSLAPAKGFDAALEGGEETLERYFDEKKSHMPEKAKELSELDVRKDILERASDSADKYFERVRKRRAERGKEALERDPSAEELERAVLDKNKEELRRLSTLDPEKKITGEESTQDIGEMLSNMDEEEAERMAEIYKDRRQTADIQDRIETLEETQEGLDPSKEEYQELDEQIGEQRRKAVEPMIEQRMARPKRDEIKNIIKAIRAGEK
jgi:hypothetical protein